MDTTTNNSRQALIGSVFIILGAVGFSAKSILIKLTYAGILLVYSNQPEAAASPDIASIISTVGPVSTLVLAYAVLDETLVRLDHGAQWRCAGEPYKTDCLTTEQ